MAMRKRQKKLKINFFIFPGESIPSILEVGTK